MPANDSNPTPDGTPLPDDNTRRSARPAIRGPAPDTPPDSVSTGADPEPNSGTFAQTPSLAERAAKLSDPRQPSGAPHTRPEIPGYALEAEIGAGGMGVVFRARDRAFDRAVAVKMLRDDHPSDSAAARRFVNEARITGQLQHPAIPPVHHLGTLPDGRPFLVMKLIKGDTLATLLAAEPVGGPAGRHTGTSRARFVAVFAQVCQAVAYAHARNVIHRDLKPANVMVGSFGEVQVMDWGLAKVLGAEEHPRLGVVESGDERTAIRSLRDPASATQDGSVMGTPSYMSPEQAGGEVELIDERADVFGLGATLCVILTGAPPYTGPNAKAVQLRALRGDTTDGFARLDASAADPELVALCKRCLARDRGDRPRDAGEVARAVTTHLAAAEERARQAELERVRVERDNAVRLKELAEAARKQVENERAKLVAFEYGRTIQMAHQECRNGNLVGARALLEVTRPELRGWEYQYVGRLCHADLLTIKGHADRVRGAAFSPDGARIVTASSDKTARVWDAGTGAELLAFRGHTGGVTGAAFGPDGTRAVTTSVDNTARVWDAATGAEIATLAGQTGKVLAASFSRDGIRAVTGNPDNSARVWDVITGSAVATLNGHTDTIRQASFSPDGARVVTAGDDTARVWDAATGNELTTIKGHTGPVRHASFSPDGTRVVTASLDRTARVWDTATGGEIAALKGHTDTVNVAAFSPDGERVVTASDDRTARVWNKAGGEMTTLIGHTGRVNAAAFSPDGRRVVTAGDQTARVWSAGRNRTAEPGSYTPFGSLPVAVKRDDSDRLGRVVQEEVTGKIIALLRRVTDRVLRAVCSLDRSLVATLSVDGLARVWDARTGEELTVLKGHSEPVISATFSPDGARIVTTSGDRTARVWDARTGRELTVLKGHTSAVSSSAFNSDGTRLVTAHSDNTARVWDTWTGEELTVLKGHTDRVISATFGPDGTRIVTASGDRTARVWDARTGEELTALKGHTGLVVSAAFSPDGTRVVTAEEALKIWVWDTLTGAELLVLVLQSQYNSYLEWASFSRDGTCVITRSYHGLIEVWDSRPVNRDFLPHEVKGPSAAP